MTCPNDLSLSIYCDGEASQEEAARIALHLGRCGVCRALGAQLRTENIAVGAAFQTAIPASPAWSWVLRLLVGAVVFVPLGFEALVKWSPSLPTSLGWVLSWGTASVLLSATRAWGSIGSDGLLLAFVGFSTTCTAFVALLLLLAWRRSGVLRAVAVAFLLCLGVFFPSRAQALTLRNAEGSTIEVGAHEVVVDTMFLSGKKVLISGVVDGDVFVAAERVEVQGTVRGNLFVVAQATEVSGTVEGAFFVGGQDVELLGRAQGGIYAVGENVFLNETSQVTKSAYLSGESIRTRGRVGRELVFAAARVTLMGEVEHSVTGFSGRFSLADGARVGGDLHVVVPAQDASVVHSGARVEGQTTVRVDESDDEEAAWTSRLVLVLLHVLAVLSMASVISALFPALTPRAPTSSLAALKAMGVGFVVLVATPVVIVLLALTLVGLPLAGVVLGGYGLLLFLASVVVASFVADYVPWPEQLPSLLRVGLTLIALLSVFQIPVVGGGISFLVMLLGMGAIVQQCRALYLHQGARAEAAEV